MITIKLVTIMCTRQEITERWKSIGFLKTSMNPIKHQAKDKIKNKLVRNKLYKLRIKSIEGSPLIETRWRCVQQIHKIRNEIVNIVIMEPVEYSDIVKLRSIGHTSFCLNKHDCIKYHIKYNQHLEVFSSLLNWIEIK